ncbi:hypothetical protein Tco_0705027 [Tanacetum coccineum]|uniref:Uncharacterized protein n=1 Tax=Tanacetum coccineum TaxID=301880 RepID=A0ABQ4Y492_9ASTR
MSRSSRLYGFAGENRGEPDEVGESNGVGCSSLSEVQVVELKWASWIRGLTGGGTIEIIGPTASNVEDIMMRSRHHEQMEMEDVYREQQKDIQDNGHMDQSSGAEYDLLEQFLLTHPHLLPAAIDQQLENLPNERDAQKEEVAPSWQIAFTSK